MSKQEEEREYYDDAIRSDFKPRCLGLLVLLSTSLAWTVMLALSKLST